MIKALKRIKSNKKKEWKYFTGVWIAIAAVVLIVLVLKLILLVV